MDENKRRCCCVTQASVPGRGKINPFLHTTPHGFASVRRKDCSKGPDCIDEENCALAMTHYERVLHGLNVLVQCDSFYILT